MNSLISGMVARTVTPADQRGNVVKLGPHVLAGHGGEQEARQSGRTRDRIELSKAVPELLGLPAADAEIEGDPRNGLPIDDPQYQGFRSIAQLRVFGLELPPT